MEKLPNRSLDEIVMKFKKPATLIEGFDVVMSGREVVSMAEELLNYRDLFGDFVPSKQAEK